MNIEEYWKTFIEKNENYNGKKYIVDSFFNNEGISDPLVELVLSGKKTGTSSCLWSYEVNKQEIPQNGTITIVVNSKNEPVCIIETKKQNVCAFRDISDNDAKNEGEGDLSLQYWKKVHKDFFISECEKVNKVFSEEMPVLYEEFEVISI